MRSSKTILLVLTAFLWCSSIVLANEAPETPANVQDDVHGLSVGGSLGLGASYALLGPKIYIGVSRMRLFGVLGLGVGVGVDIKLTNKIEAGFTRAILLGGSGWDVVALRYHVNGAFNKGWFVGVEYIGNRTHPRNETPDGAERRWFATLGYDFWSSR